MAARPRLLVDDEIRPLAEDPAYARAAAVHGTLAAALVNCDRALEILAIEGELTANTTLGTGARKGKLRDRRAKLLAMIPVAPAPATSPDGLPDAVIRGLALAAGAKVEAEEDRASNSSAFTWKNRRSKNPLALSGKSWIAARAEASLRAAEAVRDRHRGLLRQVWEAAAAFSAALDAERSCSPNCLSPALKAAPTSCIGPASFRCDAWKPSSERKRNLQDFACSSKKRSDLIMEIFKIWRTEIAAELAEARAAVAEANANWPPQRRPPTPPRRRGRSWPRRWQIGAAPGDGERAPVRVSFRCDDLRKRMALCAPVIPSRMLCIVFGICPTRFVSLMLSTRCGMPTVMQAPGG